MVGFVFRLVAACVSAIALSTMLMAATQEISVSPDTYSTFTASSDGRIIAAQKDGNSIIIGNIEDGSFRVVSEIKLPSHLITRPFGGIGEFRLTANGEKVFAVHHELQSIVEIGVTTGAVLSVTQFLDDGGDSENRKRVADFQYFEPLDAFIIQLRKRWQSFDSLLIQKRNSNLQYSVSDRVGSFSLDSRKARLFVFRTDEVELIQFDQLEFSTVWVSRDGFFESSLDYYQRPSWFYGNVFSNGALLYVCPIIGYDWYVLDTADGTILGSNESRIHNYINESVRPMLATEAPTNTCGSAGVSADGFWTIHNQYGYKDNDRSSPLDALAGYISQTPDGTFKVTASISVPDEVKFQFESFKTFDGGGLSFPTLICATEEAIERCRQPLRTGSKNNIPAELATNPPVMKPRSIVDFDVGWDGTFLGVSFREFTDDFGDDENPRATMASTLDLTGRSDFNLVPYPSENIEEHRFHGGLGNRSRVIREHQNLFGSIRFESDWLAYMSSFWPLNNDYSIALGRSPTEFLLRYRDRLTLFVSERTGAVAEHRAKSRVGDRVIFQKHEVGESLVVSHNPSQTYIECDLENGALVQRNITDNKEVWRSPILSDESTELAKMAARRVRKVFLNEGEAGAFSTGPFGQCRDLSVSSATLIPKLVFWNFLTDQIEIHSPEQSAETISGFARSPTSIAISANGDVIVIGAAYSKQSDGFDWVNSIIISQKNSLNQIELPDHDEVIDVAISADSNVVSALVKSSASRGQIEVQFFDVETTRKIGAQPVGDRLYVGHHFFPELDLLVVVSQTDGMEFIKVSKSTSLGTLQWFPPMQWLFTSPSGRYDASSPGDASFVSWVSPDRPLDPLPLEAFFREYYTPGLLGKVLRGEALPDLPAIEDLDRTLPELEIVSVEPEADGEVAIRVLARSVPSEFEPGRYTGVEGLRLMRDGQMVGEALLSADAMPSASGGEQEVVFNNVQLPSRLKGGAVEFSAYAFSEAGIKSRTIRFQHEVGDVTPVPRKAYVLAVGVDAYDDPSWNLEYAAADAREYVSRFSLGVEVDGEVIEDVSVIPLISHFSPEAGEAAATAENIETVLRVLAGETADAAALARIPGLSDISRARPDDVVVIAFSGHGYAGDDGQFYFFPQDIPAQNGREISPQLLDRAISSRELRSWVSAIDAGQFVMIIDACNSGASVAGLGGFRPGPLGSREFGQLAYDKKMTVLAASSAESVALESDEIGHGLLTYALLKEGVEGELADTFPADGRVSLLEMLEYGETRVPELYEEISTQTFEPLYRGERASSPVFADTDTDHLSSGAFQPIMFNFSENQLAQVNVR